MAKIDLQRVERTAGLDDTNIGLLKDDGITKEAELSFIKFVDLDTSISIVKRRKLELIMKFIAMDGRMLLPTTVMEGVQVAVVASKKLPSPEQTITPVDVDRGARKRALKLHLKKGSRIEAAAAAPHKVGCIWFT
eukprot:6310660-Ditylum_brightwellii.AAC.1